MQRFAQFRGPGVMGPSGSALEIRNRPSRGSPSRTFVRSSGVLVSAYLDFHLLVRGQVGHGVGGEWGRLGNSIQRSALRSVGPKFKNESESLGPVVQSSSEAALRDSRADVRAVLMRRNVKSTWGRARGCDPLARRFSGSSLRLRKELTEKFVFPPLLDCGSCQSACGPLIGLPPTVFETRHWKKQTRQTDGS